MDTTMEEEMAARDYNDYVDRYASNHRYTHDTRGIPISRPVSNTLATMTLQEFDKKVEEVVERKLKEMFGDD